MSASTFFNRQPLYLRPDPSRVVVRPFRLASEPRDLNPTDWKRADHIVGRVLAMDSDTTASLLDDVLQNFDGRHRNLLAKFEARAAEMENALTSHVDFTRSQRQLVGAYFMHEYSFEASALFNPSIVPHPDQAGAPAGGCRFVLSVRAVGEGHISSLTFRAGSIASDGSVTIDPTTRLASVPQVVNLVAGPNGDIVDIHFKDEDDISERVIFPITLAQANGIEDARFLAFEDEGRRTYYATYTAYSGGAIRSELLETTDFRSFRMTPLRGAAAANKGMGLFPRKIDGRYAMIGRQDNENRLPDLLEQPALLEWRHAHPQTKVSLGVRPDRNLRRSDRVGRGLASAHPRRWPRSQICDRRGASRPVRSIQGPRTVVRTDRSPRTVRTRRVCAQRRLYLWSDAPGLPAHRALRRVGHIFDRWDHRDRCASEDALGLKTCGAHPGRPRPRRVRAWRGFAIYAFRTLGHFLKSTTLSDRQATSRDAISLIPISRARPIGSNISRCSTTTSWRARAS